MKRLRMFLPILVLALMPFGPSAQGEDAHLLNDPPFLPEGRVLDEGRIFSLSVHDLNGDGLPDIAVSDFLAPARILFNDAGLGFNKAVPLTSTVETATTGHGIAVADFNGDDRPDIILVFNDFPARILFGDGRGEFKDGGQAIEFPDFQGTGVRVVDTDGDGDLDVILRGSQARGSGTHLLLNNGSGALTESGQALPSSYPFAAGDVDGDGDVDIVAGGVRGDPCTIWLNERGRFVRQDRSIDIDTPAGGLALADTDEDGRLDLLVWSDSASFIWLNDGRGTFSRSEQAFNPGGRMIVGDVDGDGDPDLVIGPSVWLNRGRGRYDKVQTIDALRRGIIYALVDFDGDGDVDLLGSPISRSNPRGNLLLFVNTSSGGSAQ